jgi:hypothetical protein
MIGLNGFRLKKGMKKDKKGKKKDKKDKKGKKGHKGQQETCKAKPFQAKETNTDANHKGREVPGQSCQGVYHHTQKTHG